MYCNNANTVNNFLPLRDASLPYATFTLIWRILSASPALSRASMVVDAYLLLPGTAHQAGHPKGQNEGEYCHRWGEKACYYSGVCLETGEVEAMEIAGNSNAETSTAFLQQLRANYPGPLVVIWDNGPAHRGAAIRSYLTTPNLHLRLVALPAYSPDFNADEAVWDWAREEVTANECLGTKAKVQEKMNQFFGGLAHRKEEVKRRCRSQLQARADALIFTPAVPLPSLPNVVPTLALV